MANHLVSGWLYDEDTRTLDLDSVNKIQNNPEAFGSWYTKKPWRAEINFADGVWHFNSFLQGQHLVYVKADTIFELVKKALEATKE